MYIYGAQGKFTMLRFDKTLKFLNENLKTDKKILDLGVRSELSDLMRKNGYDVTNTTTQDLDVDYSIVKDFEVITAFEIFEHLFAPFNLLSEAKGTLVASVPLKVWFRDAHWNNTDKRDCHYHEFEIKQFDHLLERTGWTIINKEIWKSPDKLRLGIRPLLRFIFPSYYIVIAKK
jgi:hypothetical protein